MPGSHESPYTIAGSLRRTWRNAGVPVDGVAGTLYGRIDPGDLLIDTTNKTLYQNTNTQASPTYTQITGTGITLDGAYDYGGAGAGRAITVDSGAITLTNNAANTNNVLEIGKSPAGAQAGSGIVITMGANATGPGITFANTGGGNDITGTAGWNITKAGVGTFDSLSIGQATLVEDVLPAGTACYIGRDNTGDVTINALTGKTVNLAVAGTDVMTIAGAAITLAQAVTISAGGLTVTGNATFNNNVTISGTFSFGGEIAASNGIDMSGSLLKLNGTDSIRSAVAGTVNHVVAGVTVLTLTATAIDLQGFELILDANGDTSITADTNDQIDIRINGADDFQFVANTFNVLTGSNLVVRDDCNLGLGTGSTVILAFDTTDLNANELVLQLPAGGATDVPVLAIGQSIKGVNLGLYDGVVDPTIALFGVGAVATSTKLDFRKARGTVAAPTVITTGDDLGLIRAYGYGGATGYVLSAQILLDSTGTIADTRVGGKIVLSTATDALPSVLTTAVTIGADQSVTLGVAADATGVLRVANNRWISAENAATNGNVNMISINGSDLVAFGANLAATTMGGTLTIAAQQISGSTGNLTFSGAGYVSIGANPAASGYIRLSNAAGIAWQNVGNTAAITLSADAADYFAFASANANGVLVNGLTLFGNSTANGDLTLAATYNATKTTSYIITSQMLDSTADGIATKVVAGAVGDGSFTATAVNGLMGIDSTNFRIYFRYGAAWHYVNQTAGFEIPEFERLCPICGLEIVVGDVVSGVVDKLLTDGARHGLWCHSGCVGDRKSAVELPNIGKHRQPAAATKIFPSAQERLAQGVVKDGADLVTPVEAARRKALR